MLNLEPLAIKFLKEHVTTNEFNSYKEWVSIDITYEYIAESYHNRCWLNYIQDFNLELNLFVDISKVNLSFENKWDGFNCPIIQSLRKNDIVCNVNCSITCSELIIYSKELTKIYQLPKEISNFIIDFDNNKTINKLKSGYYLFLLRDYYFINNCE